MGINDGRRPDRGLLYVFIVAAGAVLRTLRNERLLWYVAMALSLTGIIMVATSHAPDWWSVAELDRAKAACEGVESGNPYAACFDNALRQWRKANPDAPRGGASAWPWRD